MDGIRGSAMHQHSTAPLRMSSYEPSATPQEKLALHNGQRLIGGNSFTEVAVSACAGADARAVIWDALSAGNSDSVICATTARIIRHSAAFQVMCREIRGHSL
ncbi:hypothetical protein [Oxalicibacterium solurbis]|uniref:hypothetical protein n=1 Tax=Oxalicibacterium solurbis TaxID=69280 RepID=UPI001E34D2CC|nr:hypothetical protein [Oxalicibacterium solurbis]